MQTKGVPIFSLLFLDVGYICVDVVWYVCLLYCDL